VSQDREVTTPLRTSAFESELNDAVGIDARYAIRAFVCIWLVSIVPLCFSTYLPLYDYPFHIARVHILEHWQASQALQNWYEIRSFVLPNVGMDLVALGLVKIFPVAVAGRVFLALTLGLILSGCLVLHWYLHGYCSWCPLVAALFLFNWILLFGFLNYLLGVGLMLWASGCWVAWRRAAPWCRLLWGTLWAVALFFCHLAALGLYALIVAGYELQRSATTVRTSPSRACRDLLVGAAIFIIPLLLFVFSSTASEVSQAVKFPSPWWHRFAALQTLGSGDTMMDGMMLGVLIPGILGVIWYGRLQVARSMYMPLALLLVAYLIAPIDLVSARLVVTRLPVAILFVALSSMQVFLWNRAYSRVLLSSLVIVFVVRSLVCAYDWQRYDQVIQAFVRTFAQLPSHSILFVAQARHRNDFHHFVALRERLDPYFWQPPLHHIASLATLQQAIFVPTTFAEPAQQPIVVTSRYRPMYKYQRQNPIEVKHPEQLAAMTDHIRLLMLDTGPPPVSVFLLVLYPESLHLPLPHGATVVATGPYFLLLAVTGIGVWLGN
jgi:hypothetical protein